MRRRVAQIVRSLAPLGMLVAACSTAVPPASSTWKIDCVSVLGIPTPSGQTPRAAIPTPVGVPRDVRFVDLTDAELAQFADWEACLWGGYGHGCCTNTECPAGYDGEPPGPFRLETTPLLANAMDTCYTPGGDGVIYASREDTMSLYRNTLLSNCHVGLYEDCQIETIPGFRGGAAPDCAEVNALCDLPSD